MQVKNKHSIVFVKVCFLGFNGICAPQPSVKMFKSSLLLDRLLFEQTYSNFEATSKGLNRILFADLICLLLKG